MASSQVGSVAGARSGRCSGAMAASEGIDPASVSQSGTSSDPRSKSALSPSGRTSAGADGLAGGACGCGAGCSSSRSQSDLGSSAAVRAWAVGSTVVGRTAGGRVGCESGSSKAGARLESPVSSPRSPNPKGGVTGGGVTGGAGGWETAPSPSPASAASRPVERCGGSAVGSDGGQEGVGLAGVGSAGGVARGPVRSRSFAAAASFANRPVERPRSAPVSCLSSFAFSRSVLRRGSSPVRCPAAGGSESSSVGGSDIKGAVGLRGGAPGSSPVRSGGPSEASSIQTGMAGLADGSASGASAVGSGSRPVRPECQPVFSRLKTSGSTPSSASATSPSSGPSSS